MRVSGRQEQLVHVETWQPVAKKRAESVLDARPNHTQVARDHDGLIDNTIAVAGFQRQNIRRAAAMDALRDSNAAVARQRDRFVRRDVGRGCADPQFRGTRLCRDANGYRNAHCHAESKCQPQAFAARPVHTLLRILIPTIPQSAFISSYVRFSVNALSLIRHVPADRPSVRSPARLTTRGCRPGRFPGRPNGSWQCPTISG